MAADETLDARAASRRRLLAAGAVGVTGVWVAPSVLSLDRVAAAVGSCGTKPVQVDFTAWAGNEVPSAFTANDGTAVTMTISDPDGVQSPSWRVRVYNGTINGLDNPAITGMSGANNGAGVSFTFTFSRPIEPNFWLVDVDRNGFGWEDTVQVTGSLNGTTVAPATMTTGAVNTQIAPDTVRGLSPTTTSDGNVDVDFQTSVDTLTVRHYDVTTLTAFQWIGVHDLKWC